jgi:hypothetical protein
MSMDRLYKYPDTEKVNNGTETTCLLPTIFRLINLIVP